MNIDEMLAAVRFYTEGDYAECGVWKGSMAEKIYRGMDEHAKLWLFDSFEGHGEPGEFDDALRHPRGRYADTTPEAIRKLCPNAFVIKGFVQQTLPMLETYHYRFRFVHIDLDHYEPTKAACEFFKTRMVLGGIIRFDDYRHGECPGATLAVDEVFGRENILTEDYRWEHTSREAATGGN